ncbi:hypothetical protein P7K49_012417 [Saguinus oedipus]|uniref:Uncharacterized protein n=1 Tax=Saguinus oedipus TaxID=9490 RepID=A0ABQ9VTG9_SAGOE|nr:hypothetical protein P7K49_012417 [Saguinus oedipus]
MDQETVGNVVLLAIVTLISVIQNELSWGKLQSSLFREQGLLTPPNGGAAGNCPCSAHSFVLAFAIMVWQTLLRLRHRTVCAQDNAAQFHMRLWPAGLGSARLVHLDSLIFCDWAELAHLVPCLPPPSKRSFSHQDLRTCNPFQLDPAESRFGKTEHI